MNLYILRHAIAVERGTEGYEKDSDRPLTSKGERKMYEIAKGMKALDLTFDVILSSPFVRARRTAEIVAEVFGCEDRIRFTKRLAVGGEPEELIKEVVDEYSNKEEVMLVGHEPYLSELISHLTTGGSDLSLVMKKGGLCKLTAGSLSYSQCATLEWLLAPRHLVRIRS